VAPVARDAGREGSASAVKTATSGVGGEVSGDSQEAILAAALRAFAERGFDGATTREIATDAGVNHGLIRYYFGGKLQLWKAAVDRAFAELAVGLAGAFEDPSGGDEDERARRVLRSYVRYVGHHPEFVRLMHEEGKRRGPRMRWLVDRHVRPLYEAISGLAERAGGLPGLPADTAAIHLHYVLAGAVGLIFHQAAECKRLSGVDPCDESVIEEHARIVEYLLLGPPTQKKGTP